MSLSLSQPLSSSPLGFTDPPLTNNNVQFISTFFRKARAEELGIFLRPFLPCQKWLSCKDHASPSNINGSLSPLTPRSGFSGCVRGYPAVSMSLLTSNNFFFFQQAVTFTATKTGHFGKR